MKNYNPLAFLCCLVIFFIYGQSANALSFSELNARDQIVKYLSNDKKYTDIKIDPQDESVNFRYNGILYWVTLHKTEVSSIIEYTLHQQSIRTDKANENPRFYETQSQYALYAVNKMSLNNPFSADYENNLVKLQYVYYTSKVGEFINLFPIIMPYFNNSLNEFQKYVKEAMVTLKDNDKKGNSTEYTWLIPISTNNGTTEYRSVNLEELIDLMGKEEFKNAIASFFKNTEQNKQTQPSKPSRKVTQECTITMEREVTTKVIRY